MLLFDEVDKAKTEVADVLLELLEKEHLFEDGFLGRLHLSQHIILLSANRLDTSISRPLLDRCRVVEVKPDSPRQKERLLRRMWLATACREGVAADLPGETAAEILRHCRHRRRPRPGDRLRPPGRSTPRSGHSLPRTREEVSALFGARRRWSSRPSLSPASPTFWLPPGTAAGWFPGWWWAPDSRECPSACWAWGKPP